MYGRIQKRGYVAVKCQLRETFYNQFPNCLYVGDVFRTFGLVIGKGRSPTVRPAVNVVDDVDFGNAMELLGEFHLEQGKFLTRIIQEGFASASPAHNICVPSQALVSRAVFASPFCISHHQ